MIKRRSYTPVAVVDPRVWVLNALNVSAFNEASRYEEEPVRVLVDFRGLKFSSRDVEPSESAGDGAL